MKQIISSKNAPGAIGPYSQAVRAGNFLYISGQLPIDPATGEFAGTDIVTQTAQALKNIGAILKEADMDYSHVIKTTVLLNDINDFAPMNQEYAKYFLNDCPARAAFQVAALPKAALVEIEAVAYKE
ncbi:RidA family protein [Oscillospiraceae bacterium LTW-04]|nr:RidA family protein [Oscillospiraceae bacterium MB24-C1]